MPKPARGNCQSCLVVWYLEVSWSYLRVILAVLEVMVRRVRAGSTLRLSICNSVLWRGDKIRGGGSRGSWGALWGVDEITDSSDYARGTCRTRGK